MNIDLVLDCRAELGEGPVWDARRQRLLFVDIMRGHLHEFDPAARTDRIRHLGQPVGAVAPTMRGDWVVAARHGFFHVDPDRGGAKAIAFVEADRPTTRMNDGYCDSRGRFWAGTCSIIREPEAGSLYRLEPGGQVTRVLGGVTTSNGLDWSVDDRLMYYIDTGTRRVDVFDFDADTGAISNRRPFVSIPAERGKPDGLVVDAEGGIWVALWSGGAIDRYLPDGRLDRTITMPVTHPTKCAFGGPDLSDLYITSAWIGVPEAARGNQPHAGGVFHCRPGVKGRPAHLFAG